MANAILSPRTGEAASFADRAYYAIRELIVTLELPPGAVVREPELTEQLGIGRTPVREALRRLAQERLVEVFPRRGMFVTKVDVRDLARLCEVRVALEPEAARLAAERATQADLAELRAVLAELDGRRKRDPRALIDLDERIHRAIYHASHNPYPRGDARGVLHPRAPHLDGRARRAPTSAPRSAGTTPCSRRSCAATARAPRG